MAQREKVVLATRTFESKSDARKFFQIMLGRYQVGDRANDADVNDLTSLLQRHPESADKIGPGVSYFEVMRADYGTQCFRVVRVDGSSMRFSYLHCI